jgi:hypothetical protein
MSEATRPIRWAPRVSRDLIRRLYERDAVGIVDEDLIDEVAFALYARCKSIVCASRNLVPCAGCGLEFSIEGGRLPLLREELRCPACGWSTTGKEYRRSVKGKLLITQNRTEASPFVLYPGRLEAARTPKEKMLAIDWLVQEIHARHRPLGRPVAVNLLEGDETKVMQFLDDLFTGLSKSQAGLDAYMAWRTRLFLNSARSHRPPPELSAAGQDEPVLSEDGRGA